MEAEHLISALEETISYPWKSESSGWAPMPVEELIRKLEAEITKARNAKPVVARPFGTAIRPDWCASRSFDRQWMGDKIPAYFGNCR
jgi:hypothetical protein